MTVSENEVGIKGRFAKLGRNIFKNKECYFLIAPGVIWYAIFAYIPLFGLTLAFKTYKAKLGIFGSPWVGLENYVYVFRDQAFMQSIFRSLQLNAGRLLFAFPFPVFLALIINEVRLGSSKKILQSVFTFPHFLSWIIVASIMTNVLGMTGLLNSLIGMFGAEPVSFLGSTSFFQPMIYLTENWKSAGWSAIIYMAAIAGIDTEQYEAAVIDGATRLHRIWYITLPGIKGTATVLFILAVGNIMTAGFDQVFNLSNPATIKVAETLDMYIYRVTFQSAADFSFSTAVSLFKSVVNFILLFSADRIAKILGGSGLIS
jgi:putative aldouronate transport system permease protein